MRQILLFGVVGLFLSGCSSTGNIDTHFSCEANQPEECYSVKDGDDIALGKIKTASREPFFNERLSGNPKQNTDAKADVEATDDATASEALSDPTEAETPASALSEYRTTEELASIWIGPFVDGAGNYHPEGEIYIVVREATWK